MAAVIRGNRLTRLRSAIQGLKAYPRLTVGLSMFVLLVIGSLFAPLLSGADPIQQNLDDVFLGPSSEYPLGTDQLGRDLLSRVLYGGRLALAVAVATVFFSLLIGVTLGLLAGYAGRVVDGIIMRVMDGIMGFPDLILALAITYALGPSLWTVVAAISVVNIPRFARVIRAQVLGLREREFIASCVVAGASKFRILFRHLLPNVVDVIVVQGALTGGMAIFTAASLSFLGLGLPPPTPDWGGMLRDGYLYLQISPLQAVVPGCFIFAAMLSFNLAGDGLRDLFDPRVSPKVKRVPKSANTGSGDHKTTNPANDRLESTGSGFNQTGDTTDKVMTQTSGTTKE